MQLLLLLNFCSDFTVQPVVKANRFFCLKSILFFTKKHKYDDLLHISTNMINLLMKLRFSHLSSHVCLHYLIFLFFIFFFIFFSFPPVLPCVLPVSHLCASQLCLKIVFAQLKKSPKQALKRSRVHPKQKIYHKSVLSLTDNT